MAEQGSSQDYAEKIETLNEQLRLVLEEKQSLELEVKDIDRVLSEIAGLPDGESVYQLVGSVLVKKGRDELSKELQEKKEKDALMLQALAQREQSINEEVKRLRKEMLFRAQPFRAPTGA